jgi:integrase
MVERGERCRDLAGLSVPLAGRLVATGDGWEPYRLLDGDGVTVGAARAFFGHLLAAGRSEATVRSYGMDVLRWFRFLQAAGVAWDRAGRAEARDFCRWLQVAGKPVRPHWRTRDRPGGGPPAVASGVAYSPAVRAHCETVLRSFYDFHLEAGTGPLVNPFPLDRSRGAGRADAHHHPAEPFRRERTGLYRPVVVPRIPRSVPDEEFNEIFAALSSHRDRALVAFYVSTGARASELLSATRAGVDPARQLITVVRKGTRVVQQLPASADAFVWLRLYQLEMDGELPRGSGQPLWWTLRRPFRLLREMSIFGPAAPARLRELRTAGQRTPAEMIDRHQLACQPIRDLLVNYLRERQPSMDYGSLEQLARKLGMFWADLEAHHPGIDSLHLSAEVADAWKQRMRTKQMTISRPGGKTVIEAERICHREVLTPVRAFYLDLAQWAVDDPSRWAQWAVPCPVGRAETIQGKVQRHRKSRMDARTRERLPVLPALVGSTARQHAGAQALLHAARAAKPGGVFTAAGTALARSITTNTTASIWADDPATGNRRNLTAEEDRAFWAWATVEILRATGIRAEELVQLSHHSFVQYRLPSTGELVPLLQIAPSKTDAERLLVISPELADVLSTIIKRIRGGSRAVPLVAAYDDHERLWLPPAPVLFQRRIGAGNRAIPTATVRKLLTSALERTGLTSPDGGPLHYTLHDFRRMFLTDVIMSGLPPHIAQIIAGHRDINVTLATKLSTPTRPSRPTWPSSPAAGRCGPPRNTAPPPTPNGRNSSATSNAAKWPPAPAAEHSPPPASTSTAACDAPCTGQTPPSGTASPRSATT